jgi:hypothetical protein
MGYLQILKFLAGLSKVKFVSPPGECLERRVAANSFCKNPPSLVDEAWKCDLTGKGVSWSRDTRGKTARLLDSCFTNNSKGTLVGSPHHFALDFDLSEDDKPYTLTERCSSLPLDRLKRSFGPGLRRKIQLLSSNLLLPVTFLKK